jgi:hypothetical protein
LYDKIVLFGDSITEFAEKQENGFAFAAAVRDGELIPIQAMMAFQLRVKHNSMDILIHS